jgi:hypothetical protein
MVTTNLSEREVEERFILDPLRLITDTFNIGANEIHTIIIAGFSSIFLLS